MIQYVENWFFTLASVSIFMALTSIQVRTLRFVSHMKYDHLITGHVVENPIITDPQPINARGHAATVKSGLLSLRGSVVNRRAMAWELFAGKMGRCG